MISVVFGSEIFRPKTIMGLFKVAEEVGENGTFLYSNH